MIMNWVIHVSREEALWNGRQNFERTFVGKFVKQDFKQKICLLSEFTYGPFPASDIHSRELLAFLVNWAKHVREEGDIHAYFFNKGLK